MAPRCKKSLFLSLLSHRQSIGIRRFYNFSNLILNNGRFNSRISRIDGFCCEKAEHWTRRQKNVEIFQWHFQQFPNITIKSPFQMSAMNLPVYAVEIQLTLTTHRRVKPARRRQLKSEPLRNKKPKSLPSWIYFLIINKFSFDFLAKKPIKVKVNVRHLRVVLDSVKSALNSISNLIHFHQPPPFMASIKRYKNPEKMFVSVIYLPICWSSSS